MKDRPLIWEDTAMINVRTAEEALHLSPANVAFSANRFLAERKHEVATRQKLDPATTPFAARKEFLPRRSGESRFAPPQYVYSASPSGAVPTEFPVHSQVAQAS
jgi:hypothetical protein